MSSKNLNETSGTHGTHTQEINIKHYSKADYRDDVEDDSDNTPRDELIKSPGELKDELGETQFIPGKLDEEVAKEEEIKNGGDDEAQLMPMQIQ